MASFDPDTVNVDGLQRLLKALKRPPPIARVGILGDKNARSNGKAQGNAEIGMVHEFGSIGLGIPQRSFLRVPLSDNLGKEMDKAGALSEAEFKDVIKTKSLVPWMRKIAALAEAIVGEGFATQGFGKWRPWADPNYTNNTGMILQDTQQLRNSITSEVKDNG